jgi:hypothetical protein
VARLERNTPRIEAIQSSKDEGWIWQIRRGTRVVAVSTESYARQDSLMRSLTRLLLGLSKELGLRVPATRPKRPRRTLKRQKR